MNEYRERSPCPHRWTNAWHQGQLLFSPSFGPGLVQVYRLLKRKNLGRAAYHEAIFAGYELPAVLIDVVDGEIFLVDVDGDFFAFAGLELDFAPCDEALGRLVGGGWKGSIDFGDFTSATVAASGPTPTLNVRWLWNVPLALPRRTLTVLA